MKAAVCIAASLTLLAARSLAQSAASVPSSSELTRTERAAGWRILFDGKDASAWRGYRQQTFPRIGWELAAGCLKTVPGVAGQDLATAEQFGDFELVLEFRTAPAANSGIIYRAAESGDAPWHTGLEFQILDDPGAKTAADHPHSAGAVFDLVAPAAGKVLHPAGQWNEARIRVRNGWTQHFLNGVKVVDQPITGEDWQKRIAGSKFRDLPGFGTQPRGHIVLQYHDDEVWFRNIRVRDLAGPGPREVRLFNGRDLAGWTPFLPEGKPDQTWHVADAVLICTGQPAGYLKTERDYEDFILRLEWRFSPITKQAGNSGVLLRMTGPDQVWPRSVEAQLQSGNAGDFWNIGEVPMKTDPARLNGRNTRKTHAAERPIGEWNEYEIIVAGPRITLFVNGEKLNEAWDVQEIAGKIGLQSEGAEIHFRDVRLIPLE
jgi:hypothetical protein